MSNAQETIWSVIRVLLGFTFFWAFIDKVWGFGFATAPENAWLAGGDPTYGYLMYATKGPFAEFFQSLAGVELVTWLFMLGILFVGVTLLSGVMIRFGALAGMALYTSFYISGFIPPEHNPIVDEHVINFTLMVGIFLFTPTRFSVARWWQSMSLVIKNNFLK